MLIWVYYNKARKVIILTKTFNIRGKCKSIKLTNFKRNHSNIQFELEILEFMIFLLKTVSEFFH